MFLYTKILIILYVFKSELEINKIEGIMWPEIHLELLHNVYNSFTDIQFMQSDVIPKSKYRYYVDLKVEQDVVWFKPPSSLYTRQVIDECKEKGGGFNQTEQDGAV